MVTALQGVDLSGVYKEVLAILPIVLPVSIGFIGIRKGIGFLTGMLKGA